MWIGTGGTDTGAGLAARVGGVSVPYLDGTRDIGTSREGVVLGLCGDRADSQAVEEGGDILIIEEPCRIAGADLETVGLCLGQWSGGVTASATE